MTKDIDTPRRVGKSALMVTPLGFGAGPLGDPRVSATACVEAVGAAWRGGVRLFDTDRVSSIKILGWRRQTMFVASSPAARSLSMRCGSCAPMACVMRSCRPSTSYSSSQNSCMQRALGGASPQRLIGNELMHFSHGVKGDASARQICRRLMKCVRPQMTYYSTTLFEILVIHCTAC